MLKANQESVAAQVDGDVEHILIKDDVGHGLFWANCSLYRNRDNIHGDYVYIMDDDDYLAYDGFVGHLWEIVERYQPAIIMVKAEAAGRVLPTDLVWRRQRYPVIGNIGSGNFVVRADLWHKHIEAFCLPHAGDYTFICDVFDDIGVGEIYWFDKVCLRAQKVSDGAPERA